MEKKDEIPATAAETPAAELEKEVKINPLPAADGAVNPVKLAPGEKIPEHLTAQDVNSNVRLDKESYEKSDAIPGIFTALPIVGGTMIPESSLPMGGGKEDVTINSAAPTSTTAALAAGVPLEQPKVPEAVKESQEMAGVEPGASGISEQVREKEQVEEELKETVPEAPSTSEGTAGTGTEKSEGDKTLTEMATAAAASAVAAGGAALAAVIVTKDKAVEHAGGPTTHVPDSVEEQPYTPVQDETASTNQEGEREEVPPEEVSPAVPAEVKESIAEAGEEPEAAANTAAVEEKKAVESELLGKVKPVEAAGESAAETEANGTAPPMEAAPMEAAPTEAAAKGTEAKEAEAQPAATEPSKATSTTSDQKKKKSRLSSLFSKIKHRISGKDNKA